MWVSGGCFVWCSVNLSVLLHVIGCRRGVGVVVGCGFPVVLFGKRYYK